VLLSVSSSPASLADTLTIVDVAVAAVARRLPAHVSREDLASAGKLALVEALLRFDGPAEQLRGYCFARVRGALLDELRRLDPLSRHTRAQVTFVRRAIAALEKELHRAPTWDEIVAATGYSHETLAQLERLAEAAQACSIDETDADGDDLHAIEDEAACPARTAESVDADGSVHAALARLPSNHAHVLRRYYLDDVTLDVIAGELGVSKERVRQLREAAEKKLREDFIVLAVWQSLITRG
jgi:RNA polymerase sigma factor for flagellar operon FliA